MQNQYISAVFWHHFYLNSLKIHLVIPVIKGGTATAIIMKKFKKIIPLALAVTLTCASLPMIARADSSKVVTIGTNLSDDQKKSMYEYFGTSKDSVEQTKLPIRTNVNIWKGLHLKRRLVTRLTAALM